MEKELRLMVSLKPSGYLEHNPAYYGKLAQTAERGKLDLVFLAESEIGWDPLVLASWLISVTEQIGIGTVSATDHTQPYPVARSLAAMDHLSGGRIAWHAKVKEDAELTRHGIPLLSPDKLVERSREFVRVAEKLWESWESDALLVDKAKGRYLDADKVHRIQHAGEHFRVRGPLCLPRSPQVHPVRIGYSESDDDADILMLPAAAPETIAARYSRLQEQAQAAGRNQLVLTDLSYVLGDTEAETQRKAKNHRALGGHTREGEESRIFVGTPENLARRIEEWFDGRVSDGFNLQPAILPEDLDAFVDKVIPILQRKGLFRTAYAKGTLRQRWGLGIGKNAAAHQEEVI